MKKINREIIIGIALAIFIFAFVTSVTATSFSGGSGTEEDPWHVATASDFDNIRNHTSSAFIQVDDLELGTFIPIPSFTGTYNGSGFSITASITASGDAALFAGSDGTLENIRVTDSTISGSGVTGAIVAWNDGEVLSCSVYDTNINGNWYAGGIVGVNDGTIKESYVKNSFIHGYEMLGGLAGDNFGTIKNSYTNPSTSVEGESFIGGLVGENFGSIEDCYSAAEVVGLDVDPPPTISGRVEERLNKSVRMHIVDPVGGLIGNCAGTVINSYWDTETSGQSDSAGGEGRTTAEMTYAHAANTYVDWDFDSVWRGGEFSSENDGYPDHRHECRLLMMVARNQADVISLCEDFYEKACSTLQVQSIYNPDGWGISYFESGNYTTGEGTIWAENESWVSDRYASWLPPYPNSAQWDQAVNIIQNIKEPKIVLGHVRLQTSGPPNVPNPHPFVFTKTTQYRSQSFTFAHNGGVNADAVLDGMRDFVLNQQWNDPQWQEFAEHDVDSGRYFGFIMAHIKLNDWDVLRGLHAALSDSLVQDGAWSGRNFVFSDGYDGYAYRSKGNRGDWGDYTLQYQDFNNLDSPSVKVMSALPRYEQGDPCIIDLDEHELVYFPRTGDIQHFQNFHISSSVKWQKKPVRSPWTTIDASYTWDSFPVLDPNHSAIQTMGDEDDFEHAVKVRNFYGANIFINDQGNWESFGLDAFHSTKGYIMKHDTNNPADDLSGWITGEICEPDTIALQPGQDNWVGYYLLNNQSLQGALGSSQRDRIHSVRSSNWFWLNDRTSEFYSKRHPMEFGQMYIVTLKEGETEFEDFQWVNSRKPIYLLPDEGDWQSEWPVPSLLSFEKGSDYQVIEVHYLEEHSPIIEVGVRPEPGEYSPYIGGAVYDTEPFRIIVNGEDFEGVDLELWYLDGNQEYATPQTVEWYDLKTEKWETVGPGDLTAGNGQYHIIRITGFYEPPGGGGPTNMTGGASPNPFNPDVTLSFSIRERQDVEITVFNTRGQRVKTLARGEYEPGSYSVVWQGKNENNQAVGSGVYFYRITAGKESINGKMLMLK